MNRRIFVRLASAGTVATAILPLINCSSDRSELDKLLSLPVSLSYISEEQTILNIGKLFAEKFSANKKELKSELLINIPVKEQLNEVFIIDKLVEKIHQDFKNNNTVELDGWILSKTEAKQCAFLYLLNK